MSLDNNNRIVTVDLGERSYDVYIGGGLIYRFEELLPFELDGRRIFIVCDENTHVYAQNLRTVIQGSSAPDSKSRDTFLLTLPPGEKQKSFDTIQNVTGWMLENGLTRNSLVIAVGGGVIGDLTGFSASIVMRGVQYVHIPTTLLSQVDSSVGGKTGINTSYGKNVIGSFYQPAVVIADTDTLKTLPEREILAGYAEVLKYALIKDYEFFSWLEQNGEKVCALEPQSLLYAIEKSVQAKAHIVQADELESGNRALLNLGHTFGHAIEGAAQYDGRVLHGEAVAIGMLMAFDLSYHLNYSSMEDFERLEAHLNIIGLPTRTAFIQPPIPLKASELLELMKRDKKNTGESINLVLVRGIGDAFIQSNVDEPVIVDAWNQSLALDEKQAHLSESIKRSWISTS